MALEWLKEALGEAYTEDAEKKIADAVGKGFVSKDDFNAKNERLKTLETQIAERDEQLEALKKVSSDAEIARKLIEDLQSKNQKAKDELAELEEKHAAELAGRDFDALLSGALTAAGAKNPKAARALLDIETLKTSKDQTADINAAIEAAKKENDYLFASGEPIKNPVAPGKNEAPHKDGDTALMRSIMGLAPEKKGD